MIITEKGKEEKGMSARKENRDIEEDNNNSDQIDNDSDD